VYFIADGILEAMQQRGDRLTELFKGSNEQAKQLAM
jgi:hypothetical protein